MGAIRSFQDLEVWQRAHQLVLDVYRVTQGFPIEEEHGLIPRMRQAAVSVPVNIAEGFKRRAKSEKIRFYSASETSSEELKYLLILSRDLGYITDIDQLAADAETVSRMLSGLVQSAKSRQ